MTNPAEVLLPLAAQRTVLLTTFRRDGRPVGTAVSLAVDGDRAFVRTYESSGKIKRIRSNPLVTVAPSTFGGRPTGPATAFRARLLPADETARARALIERKHRWLHGRFVPLAHRLTGKRTVYLELRPLDERESAGLAAAA